MKSQDRHSPKSHWWDVPAFLLLFLILTIAYARLTITNWTRDLDITRSITYLGLIAGAAMGVSRFKPRWIFFLAIIYGIFVIGWRIGLSLGEGIGWQERLLSIAGRLNVIFTNLVQSRAVPDSLLFLVLMSALFWILGTHSGYHLTRHANPWFVILPIGITLVLIHTYDSFFSNRLWFLVLYLFFGLLLVARLVFLHNRERWLASRTYMPPYLGFDISRIAFAFVIGLLLLSWAAPALAEELPAAQQAWQYLKQPWNEARGTLENAFSSIRSTVGSTSQYYGPTATLGRGSTHTDTLVFSVITPQQVPEGVRLYWKARVYDQYTDGQWSSTLDTVQFFDPENSGMQFPTYADQSPGFYSFAFTTYSALSSIFTVNQPLWISRPARADVAINPDGTLDLGHFRATPMLKAGETYNLRSTLGEITVEAMHTAGTDYPDWVRERYLQLPDSITDRTRQLAENITVGLENPYDKVIAVNRYLRETIGYQEVITETIPVDQEPIDWFLFDLRKGFCNYYATSQIILLRSLGIPARIAFGYAQGELLEGTTTYNVRQYDAHAWPEVYFPNLGWVEFEPTVSQPDIVRPLGVNPNNPIGESQENTPPGESNANPNLPRPEESEGTLTENRDRTYSVLTFLAITGLIIAVVALMMPAIRRKRLRERLPHITIIAERTLKRIGIQPPRFLIEWSYRSSLTPIGKAYNEINRALIRLGVKPEISDTPTERVATLNAILPLSSKPAEFVLREYLLAVYSPSSITSGLAARQAASQIRQLSYRAWFLKLFNQYTG